MTLPLRGRTMGAAIGSSYPNAEEPPRGTAPDDRRRAALRRVAAAQQLRRAGLLARPGVAVQRAALDGLVDRPHELAVLGAGRLGVAAGDRGLEAAEVRPDRRR